MSTDHVDVLIVGAGLSGICAGHYIQSETRGKTYAILEARDSIGGTWDLFRYPGIRSDSDMHTLGYTFRPWENPKAIADGPSILEYVKETARVEGIDKHIRYGHKVVRGEWSSQANAWTVTAERTDTGETTQITANFVLSCTGYYRYDEGFTPEFPGRDRFQGQVIHPQHWPEDLDYTGKRVVVIGSGATAVTLVPAMADKAAHVTMLQRSPSYVVSLPGVDPFAEWAKRRLPHKLAHAAIRWKNVLLAMGSFQLSRRRPSAMKKFIRHGLERQLPAGYDIDRHFKPKYNPWDQRLCIVPDGDLFKAIGSDKASVVTDRIETFTETGIKLESGEELEADIIVTATGLNLLPLGGTEIVVDGEKIDFSQVITYKGVMFGGIPNAAVALGYTNASWTLKADLICSYVARLLNYMDEHGYVRATPNPAGVPAVDPFLDLTSGYVQRSLDDFPKQGPEQPWRAPQNYLIDLRTLKHGPVDDAIEFASAPAAPAKAGDDAPELLAA